MTVQETISLHPHPGDLDRDLLLRCIQECFGAPGGETAVRFIEALVMRWPS
jgi:hypothetical protein